MITTFKAARLQKIKEILANRNQVDVQTLSSILNVSAVTIRSDLDSLEKEGFIYRTHGGAILREHFPVEKQDTPGSEAFKSLPVTDSIMQIAHTASNYITDSGWVFLGGGVTCAAIAKALLNRPVNIVTNSITAAGILADNSSANVMVVGGNLYNDVVPFLSGDLAVNNIEGMYFEQTFFGVTGIDLTFGYSLSTSVEYNLFQFLRRHSKEVIIAADASKCGTTSFLSLGALDSIDVLITSNDLPDAYKNYFYEHNIKLFMSYDILPSSVSGGL